jgi:hypothetical protein
MKNEKPSVLESNTPPLICYQSHLYKHWGFLDCSQLLKIKLNCSLPINDTTKAHGIYECYHVVDLCITDKRSWSTWLLVLWVPFTLQIGPVCDTNLFPSIWVWIAFYSIHKSIGALSSQQTSDTYWCCDLDFGYCAMFKMWNFGGRVIGQCISYGRLLEASKGLNWMCCCSMGSN